MSTRWQLPHFSDKEYARRYEVVKAGMEKNGIDCLLIGGSAYGVMHPGLAEIVYLTNVNYYGWFGAYLIVPKNGEPTLLLNEVGYSPNEEISRISRDSLDEGRGYVEDASVIKDMRGCPLPDFPSAIADRVKSLGYSNGVIAVPGGPDSWSVNFKNAMVHSLPDAKFTDDPNILLNAKIIKSSEEIESIKKASRLADLSAEVLSEELKPGITEAEVFAKVEHTIAINGGLSRSVWFMGFTTPTSKPTTYCHHIMPYNNTLLRGDMFQCEIIPAWIDNYRAHVDCSFVLGEPAQPAAYTKMNDVCLDAYNAVLKKLKPGVTHAEILEAGDKPIKDAGYVRAAPLVYGMGLSLDGFVGLPKDWPLLPPIEAGMALKIISHVYDRKTNVCVRTGAGFLITSSGSERLTTFPPGLMCL